MAINLPYTTAGGIAYGEKTDRYQSPAIDLAPDRMSVSRHYICQWADWPAFTRELLGGMNAATLAWTAPLTDPDLPTLVARSCRVTGEGRPVDAGTKATYPYASVITNYESTEGDKTATGGLVGALTESFSFTADVLQMPGGSFAFAAGGTVYDDNMANIGSITGPAASLKLPEQPGKIMPQASYRLTLDKHPNPPWANISALIGEVNDAVFNPIPTGLSFAKERLLFTGVETSRQVFYDPVAGLEIDAWKMEYAFQFQRIEWNLAFNGNNDIGTIGWAQLGTPIFQLGDFDLLLQ